MTLEYQAFSSINAALFFDIEKGRKAIDYILKANIDQLENRSFLLECLRQFGCNSTNWPPDADYDTALNVSKYGPIQCPSEFIDYLMFAGRDRPKSIAEIGVATGCSSYFAAAYFYRLNRECKYWMIDIHDDTMDYDFDYFKSILPLVKAMPTTSSEFVGMAFDVVFIDGEHTHKGSLRDYQALGQYAKLCAFHDIKATYFNNEQGGIVRFWNELKQAKRETHAILEISHLRSDWMGIGIIYRGSP